VRRKNATSKNMEEGKGEGRMKDKDRIHSLVFSPSAGKAGTRAQAGD
jgi:hypothetical protein